MPRTVLFQIVSKKAPLMKNWCWVSILQATVGLVISLLLLVDLSLTLLMLLQYYSISLEAMLVVLLVLPFASVLPSAAGLNALFSHGPRRSAGLARVYALWNITSEVNLVRNVPLFQTNSNSPSYSDALHFLTTTKTSRR